MILFATIILLIFDLIVFVVNSIRIEKIKKENEELIEKNRKLRKVNIDLFYSLVSKRGDF